MMNTADRAAYRESKRDVLGVKRFVVIFFDTGTSCEVLANDWLVQDGCLIFRKIRAEEFTEYVCSFSAGSWSAVLTHGEVQIQPSAQRS